MREEQQESFTPPKRILLWDGAHIGDLIVATAILPVLKKAYPGVEIGFCIGTWASCVLENHQLISHLHYFDHPLLNRSSDPLEKKKRQSHLQWNRVIPEIREKEYDWGIDLYYFYKPNGGKLLQAAEIPTRIGFWASPAQYTFTHRIFWDHRMLHMAENHRCLLRGMDIGEEALKEFEPNLIYQNAPASKVESNDYLIFHVGTGEKARRWVPKEWKRLIEMSAELKKPIFLLGNSPEEFELCQLLENTQKEVYNYACKFSWGELISLFQGARAIVGLESMSAHLAAVLKKPCISLFGYPPGMHRWKPLNALGVVVNPENEIKQVRRGYQIGMESISAERVFSHLISLLESTAIA